MWRTYLNEEQRAINPLTLTNVIKSTYLTKDGEKNIGMWNRRFGSGWVDVSFTAMVWVPGLVSVEEIKYFELNLLFT